MPDDHRYGSPRFLSWPMLMGLGIPLAAVVWALAFARMFYMVKQVFWLYQYLFVAAWCVVMGARLLSVINDLETKDAAQIFVRKNWIWLSLIVIVAVLTGLWAILFKVGYGVITFFWLPFLASLVYLSYRVWHKRNRPRLFRCLAGGFAFSFGSVIPAYFYGVPNGIYGYFFYTPLWYLTVYVCLVRLYAGKWKYDESEEEFFEDSKGVSLTGGVLLLLLGCLIVVWRQTVASEVWFYYALGVGAAVLYLFDRFWIGRVRQDYRWACVCAILVLPAVLIYFFMPQM